MTLIQLISENIQSRQHYLSLVKAADPDVVIVENNAHKNST